MLYSCLTEAVAKSAFYLSSVVVRPALFLNRESVATGDMLRYRCIATTRGDQLNEP
jgi:hypothetical protein